MSRQRRRENAAKFEGQLNELERRDVQATIKVQEAARAVVATNEKLLTLSTLHGMLNSRVSSD